MLRMCTTVFFLYYHFLSPPWDISAFDIQSALI